MNLHLWVALDRPDLSRLLPAAFALALPVQRRLAPLTLLLCPPVFPGDLLRRGSKQPPRLSLFALHSQDPRGRVLQDEEARLSQDPHGPVARGALPWAAELAGPALSRDLGAALSLAWSESPGQAWASLYRQGVCAWSLAMGPGRQVTRFDGARLGHAQGPEQDRAELWSMGLARLLNEPLPLDPDERIALPDLFAELLGGAEELTLG